MEARNLTHPKAGEFKESISQKMAEFKNPF